MIERTEEEQEEIDKEVQRWKLDKERGFLSLENYNEDLKRIES